MATAARAGFGSIIEWLIAAGIIAATLAGGSIAVREARAVRAVTPVIAEEAAAIEPPATIPPRTISVPMLVLVDGKELRIGDRASDVLSRLGAVAQIGADAVERAAGVERITRSYNYIGSRFAIVFEAAAGTEPRVAGIYLQ